jgi:Peptidase family M28
VKRALVLLAACSTPAATPKPPDLGKLGAPGIAAFDPARLEATTKFLSSDDLRGREPGSEGDATAEQFIADQMKAIGLEPGGDDGTYFQTMQLRRADRVDASTELVIHGPGGDLALVQDKDAQIWAEPRDGNVAIDAPLVFVGYGLAVPGYDDLDGVDVRGAIAVIYGGAPRTINNRTLDSAEHAVLSDIKPRTIALRDRGARAVIAIFDPVRAELTPFELWMPKVHGPSMAWMEHGAVGSLPVLPMVTIGEAGADRLGGGPKLHKIWEQLDRGVVSRLSLEATATLRIHSTLKDITSRNVIGRLRGSDPSAGTVIYTAHHDHLGVGPAVDGDTIYNGALDNAIGCAGILEIARAFAALPLRPRRDILFIAVAGEEKGLLGSDYYASHPTVPLANIAANINIDGLNGLWEPHDVVPLGAEHSATLAAHASAAAAALGYRISPDPEPAEVAFIRSDQYSFAKRGVVAAFPGSGYLDEHGGLEVNRAIADDWSVHRYHKPSDVWFPGVHAEWALREAAFDFLFGLSVAIAAERPHWNAGDVFATMR